MSEWQDISTAPKSRRIRVWAAGVETHAAWNKDEWNKNPRPYWAIEYYGTTTQQRRHQPTHWAECAAAPSGIGR